MKTQHIIIIITTSIILFIIIGIALYLYANDNKIKLKNIGYSNLEANEILKLTDKEINKILEYDYNKDLIYIIESNNYNSKKIDLYLKYIIA